MPKAMESLDKRIGFNEERCASAVYGEDMVAFVNLKLAALGQPVYGRADAYPFLEQSRSLMEHYQAKDQWSQSLLPPVDQRIQAFLHRYLDDVAGVDKAQLPTNTFVLSQHGLARTVSLPADADEYHSEIISSYRLDNGILHNPKSDRRTTKGVFHVCEGGLPIPEDKKAVPKEAFAKILLDALQPPQSLMALPFTDNQQNKAHAWISLLLRPVVCPEIPGYRPQKSLEVRFLVPGNFACNLDFVESIFGNAGDPFLPENDAALDVDGWTGTTGCVILAPHVLRLRKKDLGLPHIDQATERQKRDSMCWEREDELYNDGTPFKLTARDSSGVVVTIISDNYFGYCKKEVKTQIGFTANLTGMAEEEHAGGALAFPSYDLGEDFQLSEVMTEQSGGYAQLLSHYGDRVLAMDEGYAIDKQHPQVLYIPEGARFSLPQQRITWSNERGEQQLKLLADKIYILPGGYKVQLVKPGEGRRWRLIGTTPVGTHCHKPCTVSGGGKSEISKSIADAIIQAPFYVPDLPRDLDRVDEVLGREYGQHYKDPARHRVPGRPILSPERSLGSVIKLLTPSPEFTDEHNRFVEGLPTQVKELVLLIKRFYKPDWGDQWRDRFTVDIINGVPGHELRYRGNPVITHYLRVGYAEDGSWRVFGLRKDFAPAAKIQTEDDITASVVVPASRVPAAEKLHGENSVKLIYNCEYRLFQRPDDAIHRGYDKRTEQDMSKPGNFFSNYQPLDAKEVRQMVEDAVRFDYFTEPMKRLLRNYIAPGQDKKPEYLVCSAEPRRIDGAPSKNPRYLQTRTGLEEPVARYVAEMGHRLYHGLKSEQAALFPVDGVLTGHRNNPPEGPVRALAVFNPLHYLPLPEAFMEFTSSMTGKSPSTTGAGSEGALTKGPFNALLPITDLNNALVAFVVTGQPAWVSAAAWVGPKFRVDHDISLLIPELWCRMKPEERDPQWLIEQGFLELSPDVSEGGRTIPGAILGYRINNSFVNHFMGRIFSTPHVLFDEDMLKPELQDKTVFLDGIDNMLVTHKRVAANYFADGSYELACPPLKALLEVMRDGRFGADGLGSPELRALFDRKTILESDWYQERLDRLQATEIAAAQKRVDYLQSYPLQWAPLESIRQRAHDLLQEVQTPTYRESLKGTIGCDRLEF